MELVEVEIIGMVITARYGTLNTGDILRTDAAFAKHLVDDCNAAKYPKAVAEPAAAQAEGKKTRQKREKPKQEDMPAPDSAASLDLAPDQQSQPTEALPDTPDLADQPLGE